jgi:hypothetical protein
VNVDGTIMDDKTSILYRLGNTVVYDISESLNGQHWG